MQSPAIPGWRSSVRVADSTAAAAYLFTAEADCRCGNPPAAGAAAGASATFVFEGGSAVFLPLVIR